MGRNKCPLIVNLDTTVDQAGNVLIRKAASKGMGNRPGVVLQADMDMVVQGRPGRDFAPLSDPIQALDSALLDAGTTVMSVWGLAGGQSASSGRTSAWTLRQIPAQ